MSLLLVQGHLLGAKCSLWQKLGQSVGITCRHSIPVAGKLCGCRSLLFFCVIHRACDSVRSEMILGVILVTVAGLTVQAPSLPWRRRALGCSPGVGGQAGAGSIVQPRSLQQRAAAKRPTTSSEVFYTRVGLPLAFVSLAVAVY